MSDTEYNEQDDGTLKIKDLPKQERPRERLLRYGPEKLSNPELLAILLRSGSQGESVLQLAQRLLKNFRKLRHLADTSLKELQEIRGVGPAKASQVCAGLELAKRLSREQLSEQTDLSSPDKVFELLKLDLQDRKKERFILLILNGKNNLLEQKVISEGTLTSSLVHPREVFKPAIRASAAGVVFAHNHPSGDPTPSREDIDITERLVEAGELIGIPVIDHVIIGDQSYRSFQELNLL